MPIKHIKQYQDTIGELYPDFYKNITPKDGSTMATKNVTFQVTDACNLRCFAKNTKILMSDFTYKNIEDIKVGDSVMAFNEHTKKNAQLKLIPTTVTHTFYRHDTLRKITAGNDTVYTTNEHPFLDGRRHWVRAESLADKVTKFVGINEYKNILNDNNYIIGYLCAAFLGDDTLAWFKNGELRESTNNNNQNRLAVKDNEIIERVQKYLDYLKIQYTLKPFKISTKYNIINNALYLTGKEQSDWLKNIILSNLNKNQSPEYCCGFLAGIIDTEGSLSSVLRIYNCNDDIIEQCCTAFKILNYKFIFDKERKTKNLTCKTLRFINDNNQLLNFLQQVQPACPRKNLQYLVGKALIKREQVAENISTNEYAEVYNFETETHTYIANNFFVHNCTYCYQINKSTHVMPFETAKEFIELLLEKGNDKTAEYYDTWNSKAVIIEFIGGEPFLQIDLIDQITDYFIRRMIETNHPWQYHYMISICSNGLLYFDPKVQAYLKKHLHHLSFSISIDGNKKLHDACRVQPDGSGSYDIAMKGVRHFIDVLGGQMGSKMTLAPGNIMYTAEAIQSIIENGYTDINLNCVFEEGWTEEHAKIFYEQLKLAADYLLEHDLEDEVYLSIFDEHFFKPKSREDTKTWCWGEGTLILTNKGYKPIEQLNVGDLVYTHTGELKPITNIMSHFAENVCTIKVPGVLPSVVTTDHKLFVTPFNHIGFGYKKYYDDLTKVAIKDIKHQDLLHLAKLNSHEVSYDPNICYLVGRFLGDGYTVRRSDNPDKALSKVITCGFKKTAELEKYFKYANIKYSIQQNKTANQLYIWSDTTSEGYNNKILNSILADCGILAANKHIPAECYNWSIESLEALINGYLDADGYDKGNYRVFNTVSKTLAEDLMLILRTIGYCPTCFFAKRLPKCIICGREVNQQNRYEIRFKKDKTARHIKQTTNDCTTYNLKMLPAEPQVVYNITVEDNHSYIANGLVSSNCGGNGQMISVDYKGDIYPCIRYMESSLGSTAEPIIVGNVETGFFANAHQHDCFKCLKATTRISESSEECLDCPIADGCAECLAYNYQRYGLPIKRATFICIMHKARCLANAYYFNKKYKKANSNKRFKIWLPDEEALKIVSQEELDKLHYMETHL